jgi:predicted sulfurtransferase
MDESMEESIRIEKIMLQKIQELKIENTELNTKLGLLYQDKATSQDKATTTTDEEEEEEPVKTCQKCNNPTESEDDLLCHSCYHESCNETGDECWCENDEPVLSIKKPLEESNNLLDAFDEELNFRKI